MKLERRKAIITGASSGIGQAIAKALSAEGAGVALLARREDRIRSLAAELESPETPAYSFPVDLNHRGAAQDAVNLAASALGGVDILINAAGVGRQAKLIDGDIDDWQTMLDINVMALAIVTREALPHIPEKGGHIVNISSMSGHRVPGKGGFYAATKFAVRAMTEGLRQELRAQGNLTRVSSISPGFVDTELLEDYFQSSGSGSHYDAISYPILKPEEIAELVLHQLTLPETAEVTDILVRPTGQAT
ncbi:MAG: SDR family NAD(P)-dependent oxidoreductase [Verrucomicrobiales bacterium]|jgi:NADP-dependent 3-hydroxy acid dehydrogenase YdfG|nr:SDR family NAD(P)-dependent oxidoreductase [Verrucomicrobiales bacterium]